MPDEEPKIFIDEGWKDRVQREKAEAAREAEEAAKSAKDAPAKAPVASGLGASVGLGVEALPASPDSEGSPGQEDEEGMPPASFETLVASLATQAMVALGALMQPGQQEVLVDLDQAKFSIDILLVLKEKTQGNLSAEEQGYLLQATSELQQLFMARVQQIQAQSMRQAGIDPAKLKGGLA